MIVPVITSMSEDAMSSVPNKIREGAYGLGATKFEVATKLFYLQPLQELLHQSY